MNNEHDYLIRLDYPLDRGKLIAAMHEAENYKTSYIDSRYNNIQLKNWQISHWSNNYVQQIMDDFEVLGSPRFYWLAANSCIPPHIDNETTCSINFILNDNPAPVNFSKFSFVYTQCLLNTSVIHWVRNNDTDRLLFKISIFNESYADLSKRIKYRAKLLS